MKNGGQPSNPELDSQAIEALKIANKQWESSVTFMVSAYWTKSDILSKLGYKDEALANYTKIISYFHSKFGDSYSELPLVKSTRVKIKETESYQPRKTVNLFPSKTQPIMALPPRPQTAVNIRIKRSKLNSTTKLKKRKGSVNRTRPQSATHKFGVAKRSTQPKLAKTLLM